MDVLNTLREEALEPEYRTHRLHRRRPGIMVAGLALVGALFGLAAASTVRTAPAAEQERASLIARIEAAESELGERQQQVQTLLGENAELDAALGGTQPGDASRAQTLAMGAGAAAAAGPGIRITLADGPNATVTGSEVVDADLRMAVNGLWQAGAEAVSINGQRISGLTAIRNAGDAITVNYRSISPPYRIEAIGDPDRLAEQFPTTPGGQWLVGLVQHYGIAWDMSRERGLRVGAATDLDIEHAVRRG
ncbi:MAG: DUF881 domain-containing protein [Propioniciclava sp.]